MLLIDRNILNNISGLNITTNRHDTESKKWWVSFLNSESIVLNPLLCAIGGKSRTVPTYEEFVELFDDACGVIGTYLPKSKIISFDELEIMAMV